MPRAVLIVLAALAAAAGCGGSDSGGGGGGPEPIPLSDARPAKPPPPRLDRASFVREANRLCREGTPRLDRLLRAQEEYANRTGAIPAGLAERIVGETLRHRARLRALRPPASFETRYELIVESEAETDAWAARVRDAIRRRDGRAYFVLWLRVLSREQEKAIRQLDLDDCALDATADDLKALAG